MVCSLCRPQLAYTLPDGKAGILLAESPEFAVLVTIDGDSPPFASTLYLVHKGDNAIYAQLSFNNDVVMAGTDAGILQIYNDKLGYLIDEHTSESSEEHIAHRQLRWAFRNRQAYHRARLLGGNFYSETTAVISSWSTDGSVKSRPHLKLNGIARGCYVSGTTYEVYSSRTIED